MIRADQPTILPPGVRAIVSSYAEGTIRHPDLDPAAGANIQKWCQQLALPLGQTLGVYITYGDDRTYTDIVDVTKPRDISGASTPAGWIKADVLVTDTLGLALLLPVADCNAVLYADPARGVIALAHIGRHAAVNDLAAKVVRHMQQRYGSQPRDIMIYNSPSIRAASYHLPHLAQTPLTRWHQPPYATPRGDGTYAVDLVKYNYDQWIEAGIAPEHIEVCDVDTATSANYPSHFAGRPGRFAVLAWRS